MSADPTPAVHSGTGDGAKRAQGPNGRPPGAGPRRRSRLGGLAVAVLALFIVALGGIAAYVVAERGETRYGARAALLYDDDAAASLADGPRVMATQRALLQSDSVLLPAAAGIADVDDLRERLSVDLAQDSVLRVTVEDANRARAVVLARRIVRSYIQRVRDTSAARPAANQAYVRRQLRGVERQVVDAERELRTVESTSAAAQAGQERVRSLLAQRTSLEDRLLELRLSEPVPEVRVLSEPAALDSPVQPRPLPAAAAGLAMGLLVAAGVVMALQRRRSRAT